MTQKKVTYRYAKALLMTAQESGQLEEVNQDFQRIRKIMEESREFDYLLKSPVVQFWKKKQIFEELFKDRILKLTLSFILILTEKRRENLLKEIIEQWNKQYFEIHGLVSAVITTATDIDDNTKGKLLNKLSKIKDKKIIPTYMIDKNLIGGLIVRIEDWVFDASIRNQIEMLYNQLSGIR